ncbi:MAG: DUF1559 domain-containing protein [Planctomycetota bacterium]|nr:MAG: DUF1559 domain-containing protein [Planctomycetota bacterium]
MARPKKSRGFTLVELLVVITIIGMLVSLLLPAIQAAREAGRRTTCMNNMRQAAIALSSVAETQRGFPGYANPIEKSAPTQATYITSWVVPSLPNIEQSVLYQNWANPSLPLDWSTPELRNQFITQLATLQCPSNADPNLADDALSFVVNTGIAVTANDNFPPSYANPNWEEDPAGGVCFDQVHLDYTPTSLYTWGVRRSNMDYITANDGSTNTLLVTENLQSGGWATDPTNTNLPFQSSFAARQCTGFVAFITGQQNNEVPPVMGMQSNYDVDAIGINDKAQVVTGLPQTPWVAGSTSVPTGLAYARPSAYHSGGVNAMFCGGNQRFLSESIDYKVYTQLVTPAQTKLVVDRDSMGLPIRANYTDPPAITILSPGAPGSVTGALVPWPYVLDEGDL